MWFLIRSAFWLGLVFSWIDWPSGGPSLPDGREIASVAASGVAAWCADHPAPCAEAARKSMEAGGIAPAQALSTAVAMTAFKQAPRAGKPRATE